MKKKMLALAVTATLISTGCTMNEIKQNTASGWNKTTDFMQEHAEVVGAVAGAAIGYAVSGKNDRGLGMLAGALAGGLIGNKIGNYLDEKDRQQLEAYSLQQLNTNKAGGASNWASAETGASAVVTTGASTMKTKPVEVVKLKHVEVTPNLKLVGESYESTTSLNVRSSPRVTADNKVGGLKQGAEITAVGTTGDWTLIAQNGISVGYVSSKYIKPAATQMTSMRDEGIDLDMLDEEAVVAGIDLDGIDLDSVDLDKVEVVAATECRAVNYDITSAEGKKGQTSFNACRGADGAWELS